MPNFFLVAGVFFGSTSRGLALSFLVGIIPFTQRLRRLVSIASGLVLIGLGLWTPLSLLMKA